MAITVDFMFRGANVLSLDSKGRLAVPAEYRNELIERCDGNLVVTVNNTREKCLWLYPMDVWQQVEEKVVNLPSFDPNHQKLKRFLIGYARNLEMDKSGRILIPGPLRGFALLNKSVYLVGQGNKFEIWNEDIWVEKCNQWMEEDLDLDKVSAEMEQIAL